MPFNSYLFLLVFLPATLAAYYLLALTALHKFRLALLVLATILFYSYGAARYLPLLLGSVVFNYAIANFLTRTGGRTKTLLLWFGVVTDVTLLLYYKYFAFLLVNLGLLFGHDTAITGPALPLAISFYTFQQIAFLVDTARGTVAPTRPLAYASSILFFPYIVSGPIAFYREVGPQFEQRPERSAVAGNLLVGVIMLSLGLFKKTVVADSFALWVDPVFGTAAGGAPVSFTGGWSMLLAYWLQLYFDFSGYTDMALGIARMFGILLPMNFFSPVRCTSIIDYWRRWHMTLGRFCNFYIFQSIAVPLSRWAAMRGMGRKGLLAVGTFVPTFLTMLIIGAWHGGNWTYFVFGVMHGCFMIVNEAWRFATRKRRKANPVPSRSSLIKGNVLTMLAVLLALVPFRAADMPTAMNVWTGLVGLHGFGGDIAHFHGLANLSALALIAAVIAGFVFVYLMPNTEQFMTDYEPALEWPKWRDVSRP